MFDRTGLDIFNSSVNGPLPVGQTWVFAISTESSNCGGFTQSQTQTLTTAGSTIKFPFGPDETGPGPLPGADYVLTGITNAGGETIKFDLVPVLQSTANLGNTSFNTFSPGPNFTGFTCDPYGDLSEVGDFSGSPNHVCAEVHLNCSAGDGPGDCATFFYTLTADYTVPRTYAGAGNAELEALGSCPSNTWSLNIFETVTVDEIRKKSGGNPATSCFVAANGVQANGTPAPLVQKGQTFVSFEGLEVLFTATPPKLNKIVAGFPAPLSFDYIAPNLTSASFSPEAFRSIVRLDYPQGARRFPYRVSWLT